jgi:hypothetical protein
LFEETDPARIREILEGIRAGSTGTSCMCCGWPSIEFYRGDELLVTLSVHHGQSLRWPGHEGGDARMSVRTAAWLKDWLRERAQWYWADEDTIVTLP